MGEGRDEPGVKGYYRGEERDGEKGQGRRDRCMGRREREKRTWKRVE